MRNNPFAPEVPCHRVLAGDGGIGGFGGEWEKGSGVGKKGLGKGKVVGMGIGRSALGGKQREKMEMLRGEGVGFDGNGRVVGRVWDGFWDGVDFEREIVRRGGGGDGAGDVRADDDKNNDIPG